ncbi:MAG: hypothetical protein Q7S87_18230 [Agitococcus sp.]|nr:hypothetical protein [Agitococcus sp.]
MGGHLGAFGVARKHHYHEGVDLYGMPGDDVLAMESGIVVARQAFTGASAQSPWWNETQCLMIEGASGVLNYGEIHCAFPLEQGAAVHAGQVIGQLVRVLQVDKGRPCTMLHLERYVRGTLVPIVSWPLPDPQPEQLCDVSALLLQSIKGATPC